MGSTKSYAASGQRAHLSACTALAIGLLATASPALAAELKVTATIKPIHALVAQVMEGVGTPSLLVQGAASPHTYALKPSDARALNHADVFFRVSESVEPFTRKIVTALPKTVRTVTLADAPGVEALAIRTGETFEAHDHDHGDGHEHAHDHDHDGHDHAADKHDDHDHAHETRDGHVWLDPENARKMVAEIARVLSEASPADAEKFKANAARADAALVALQAEIARDLEPLKGKPYVVFHDAYQYFERRFGLSAVGSITVSPEAQPSAKRLTEIRKKLTTLSASCVFAEPQFQAKLVAAVTEGTSARSGTLDPEGARIEPGPGAYDALLRNLASGLKSCLAPQS
ncbi:MAG TPA: zinc ABC transporter substrate-binding protein ZnuA [Hyphomicrobium sp.]|nr:zinc ABC transporter substrate-binding protein ZnuA [Hyphomicrobium sp.]